MIARSLPGYRFLECLGRGALGETWTARGPDGRLVAVKFVIGFAGESTAEVRLESVRRLKYVHHPGLLHVEEVKIDEGRLLLITQPAAETLRDRFEKCRRDGEGLPQGELVARLHDAAAALDWLAQKHFLRHWGLNPRNLLLRDEGLLVADYALIPLIWVPAGQPIGQLNARYAAPELFVTEPHAASDQYSLAVIYHEMRTGHLPHRGVTVRQLIAARLEEKPDLHQLEAEEREIVARAMHRDPEKRFATAAEFLQALGLPAAGAVPASLPPVPRPFAVERLELAPEVDVEQIVTEVVGAAARAAQVQVREFRGIRYHLHPDGSMRHQCAAWLPEGVAAYKLKGFLQTWKARLVVRSDDYLVMHVGEPNRLWKRLTGKRGIEVQIRLSRGLLPSSKLTAVNVRIRPLREDENTFALMRKVGPMMLEHLHTHLLAAPEQRVQERFPWEQPLLASADPAAGVACRGKDVSFTGVGFYASFAPEVGSVLYVQQLAVGVALPTAVARVEPTGDGWFEVGARFLLDRPAVRLESAEPDPAKLESTPN